MIAKDEYARIRSELDHAPSALAGIATLALNAVTIGGGLVLLQLHGVWPYLASQLLLAIGMFQAFGILHECGHGSFSANRTVNTVVGHVAGALSLLPYYSWKHIHTQHHVWAGHLEMDPAVRVLHLWRRNKRIPLVARVLWRSWLPVVAVIQIVVFWLYPLQLAGKPAERRKLLECVASVAVLLGLYAATVALVLQFHLSANVLLAVALYAFITELVNVPHHSDSPGYGRKLGAREQSAIARSCDYPPVISELLVLNFNFHVEHHLFPKLPWYRLRAARDLVRPALGKRYRESVGVRWNLKHRNRDMQDVMLVDAEEADSSAHAPGVG